MHVHVIAVAKVKQRGLRETLDDYFGRIGRYAKLHETELRDGNAQVVEQRFRKAIPPRSRVVALEVEGKAYNSMQLSKFVGRCENDGIQSAVFLIGGSYGLPKAISDEADLKLSLSAMTLPHRLARVFLAEQIYRAFTILRNEPYNH